MNREQKVVLILDLDGTLIYSSEKELEHPYEVEFETMGYTYFLYKRPHLDLFLKCCYEWFDVRIWTAAFKDYAETVVDLLLPHELERPVIYSREHCTDFKARLVKDLSTLNDFDAKSTIIIDDFHKSFRFQPNNGLLINSFEGNPKDTSLLEMLPFLWSIYMKQCVEPEFNPFWRDYAKFIVIFMKKLFLNSTKLRERLEECYKDLYIVS